MSTETNLGKIHLFPSEKSYTTNKSSVNTNDIALIKSNLMDELKGNTTPTLTALIDWNRMKTLNSGVETRNHSSTNSGLKSYGGDYSFPVVTGGTSYQAPILLKQSYTNFDKLLVVSSGDNADYCFARLWNVWEFQSIMNMGGQIQLAVNYGLYWYIYPHVGNWTVKSTETTFFTVTQNSSIVEIYGVKY